MLQSLLIRFLLCYVMIAAIFARPLVSDKEKRQSVFKEMEDVQLNKNGKFSVGQHQCTASYI